VPNLQYLHYCEVLIFQFYGVSFCLMFSSQVIAVPVVISLKLPRTKKSLG